MFGKCKILLCDVCNKLLNQELEQKINILDYIINKDSSESEHKRENELLTTKGNYNSSILAFQKVQKYSFKDDTIFIPIYIHFIVNTFFPFHIHRLVLNINKHNSVFENILNYLKKEELLKNIKNPKIQLFMLNLNQYNIDYNTIIYNNLILYESKIQLFENCNIYDIDANKLYWVNIL
jgi:hypothetical protein